MLLGKKRKLGRSIEDISIGEKLSLTEKMEDKELLLYLGLTGDANPLYIQHDYASLTPYKKPLVPGVMLSGIITSAISKYLPGPGSYITQKNINYLKPVCHYETIQFLLEVTGKHDSYIIISFSGRNEQEESVMEGTMHVCPPQMADPADGQDFNNF